MVSFSDAAVGRNVAASAAKEETTAAKPNFRTISSSSSTSDHSPRDSPKRPPEEPLEEEGKISPKRLSLQFRPDRISSTSTPFGDSRAVLPSSKGVRALSFDCGNGASDNYVEKSSIINSRNNEENTHYHNHPQHPNRKARLSFNPNETFTLQPIAEHENPQFPNKGTDDQNDQSSIIAHGFPSSFFYSPAAVEARSTSGAAAAEVLPSGAAASGATSRQRRSMPPNIASATSPSTQRFREALSAEISRRRLSLADQPSTIRRLSLDYDRCSSTSGASTVPSTVSDAFSSNGGFAPFSPSKHPMLTRSSASVMSLKEQEETDASKLPFVSKASLYSLYEALSQVLNCDIGYLDGIEI